MKKLISAETIRQARASNVRRVEVCMPDCIVTPEAKTVAVQLGVELVLLGPGQKAAPVAAPAPSPVSVAAPAGGVDDAAVKAICAGVLSSYPAGSLPSNLVEQLVRKAVQEADGSADPVAAPLYKSYTGSGGIKVVQGDSLRYERFDGAGPGTNVRIVDVITAADNSSMATGFMEWENLFFPWTLTYDEVDIILEGELHIRHKGETFVCRKGDVLFIPKNSSIEFGTPSKVRFMYVAFPANWQEC